MRHMQNGKRQQACCDMRKKKYNKRMGVDTRIGADMGVEQEKIEIPQVTYQGKDKKLKERVTKFKAGTFRIAVFTVVGLIMGGFSHVQYYKDDPFRLARMIFMIPHKLTEALYFLFGVEMGGSNALVGEKIIIPWGWEMGAFSRSYVAAVLAETVCPVLAGGAIYGLLAYFTGDKRVFTPRRFFKFAGCWCTVLLLLVGASLGINAKAEAANERLSGDAYDIDLYRRTMNGWFDVNIFNREPELGILKESLWNGLEALDASEVVRERESEQPMVILFDESFSPRGGIYWVNYKERYLVTEKGRFYRISEEFARIVQEYVENDVLPGT